MRNEDEDDGEDDMKVVVVDWVEEGGGERGGDRGGQEGGGGVLRTLRYSSRKDARLRATLYVWLRPKSFLPAEPRWTGKCRDRSAPCPISTVFHI